MARTFDETELLNRVDQDLGFLADTVEMLAADGPPLLAQIRAALDAGDAPGVGRTAHALKGMLSNFCAPAAQAGALEVEKAGKSGDLAGAGGRIAALERHVADLTAELESFVRARAS